MIVIAADTHKRSHTPVAVASSRAIATASRLASQPLLHTV